jgi:DNA-binding winged helix-turn-helix (wHTH) protein
LKRAELEAKLADLCGSKAEAMELAFSAETLTLHLPDGLTITYPNPLTFLLENAISFEKLVLSATVPGPLHTRNILVDRQRHNWLILDFDQVYQRPVLHDFVAMEVAIKFELLEAFDLKTRYELEKRLLAVSSLEEEINSEDLGEEAQKALQVISHIRRLAARVVQHDLKLYLAGLLVHTVDYLKGYDPQGQYRRRELILYKHSLLSAAMLCTALTPPQEFILDLSRKLVIVEGRQFKDDDLTLREWAILTCLASRQGECCTHEYLLKEVWNYEYKSADKMKKLEIDADKGPLMAAIRRLRHKLEPNPLNPKYIVNVREQGYKLVI